MGKVAVDVLFNFSAIDAIALGNHTNNLSERRMATSSLK